MSIKRDYVGGVTSIFKDRSSWVPIKKLRMLESENEVVWGTWVA